MQRNPHTLSAPYVIDPAYAVDRSIPGKSGLSLFSEKKEGPCWLYGFGDLEAWLFSRTRLEAYATCTNISYPGSYRTFNPMLSARKQFSLPKLPHTLPCSFYACGRLEIRINNQLAFNEYSGEKPQKYVLDIVSYLSEGSNDINVSLHSPAEPPTFLMSCTAIETDATWQVRHHTTGWNIPQCLPFEGDRYFPHQEDLPVIKCNPLSVNKGVYDFGYEVVGSPDISVYGKGTISIQVGESYEEVIDNEDKGEQVVPSLTASDKTYRIRERLALRYLRISHDKDTVTDGVHVLASFYPTRYGGAFACSDERLTKIWLHAAYTLRVCMRLLLVDGAKRDRLPWVGDLFVGGLCNYYVFFEQRIVRHSLVALFGENPDESGFNGIIDYTLWWVIAVRDYVMHTGDIEFLRHMVPCIEQVLTAISSKIDNNGLLPSNRFQWLFIDWRPVEKDGYSGFLNMLYGMALQAGAEIYGIAGEKAQADAMTEQNHKMLVTCRRMFWDEQQHVFVDTVVDDKRGTTVSRHTNIFAILSGVVTKLQQEHILDKVLLNKSIPQVGTPYMRFFEARALGKCGAIEQLLASINDYWGGMLDKGATTFWEAYDESESGKEHYAFYQRPFGKSLCHAWSAGPLFLLSAEVLGVKPLAPGWSRFTIEPRSIDQDWMCVSIPTPHGNIGIDLEHEVLHIDVPKDTTLELKGDNGGLQHYHGPCRVERNIGVVMRETTGDLQNTHEIL